MRTRTFQPRTSAQFQTVSDLKRLSQGLDIQTQKVEEKLADVQDAEELLELLRSKSSDLASLSMELEQLRAIHASKTVREMLAAKPLLDDLASKQPLLYQLSENAQYFPRVAHSIEMLEHLEKFTPHLDLLKRSIGALHELNLRVEERRGLPRWRRAWNYFLERLKFTPI
jgi:hypothetical protein